MNQMKTWPSLEGWEATRDSLHAYIKVAGAPARLLAEPHPKWWHISMKVTQIGLSSADMEHTALTDQPLRTQLNLHAHTLELLVDGETDSQFDLTAGETATALGLKLQGALANLGVDIELPEDQYGDMSARVYDPEMAQRYLAALTAANAAMLKLHAELEGDRSPVQLWPHHFDLAFEWFGTKTITYEEGGEEHQSPAQINFGFAPGDSSLEEPYFYSNPWPLASEIVNNSLPHGATWFTDGFDGTLLPYSTLVGDPGAESKLLDYYRRVFLLAKPTLMI